MSGLFPFSATSTFLSISEPRLLSLVMRKRDQLLNNMEKLRCELGVLWYCKWRKMILKNSFLEQLCDLTHILIANLIFDWLEFCKENNITYGILCERKIFYYWTTFYSHSLNTFKSHPYMDWPISKVNNANHYFFSC